MKMSTMDRDDQRENDDITDVANMAQIDLANEAENLNNASTVVGSEVKSAPGGDKAVSVNEQGIATSFAFFIQNFSTAQARGAGSEQSRRYPASNSGRRAFDGSCARRSHQNNNLEGDPCRFSQINPV